ncbi:venom protease [Bactrocera dorsalis]|uniref:CLIP domain-containing serine protease n=1 Tax=Bactrocera dorsalis TaxID=27457 RepID=A0ABM3JUG2_BACDO|nr:venom protease [Bactrocera dorsalis]
MKRRLCDFKAKKCFVLIAWLLNIVESIESQFCVDSRQRSGQCVYLNSCPQLIQDYYEAARFSPNLPDFQTYVSGAMCGYDGINFMICCVANRNIQPPGGIPNLPTPQQNNPYAAAFKFSSLNSLPNVPTSTLAMPTTATSPIIPSYLPPINMPESTKPPANPPNLPPYTPSANSSAAIVPTRLAPKRSGAQCGVSTAYTNKVVGGTEARRGAYPWIVALGYRDENRVNSLQYLCAGSLISNRYILTSGHCINSLLITARLGAHDISDPNETGAISIPIERKIIHEQYNSQYIINDIALVRLSAPAPSSAYISTICLPQGERFAKDFVGNNPFVAGWGAVKFQGPSSNVLRDVQVPIVTQQTCIRSYKAAFQNLVFTDRFICAGNSHVDACQGDSGGPLMMPMLENGAYHYYILGLVSYGYECARPGFPGVYTRVASYIPWILSHMV